jgi:hypothetical protein
MREIAADDDAAFWDWHAAMGGADSILAFIKKGLVEPDRIHLKKSGDELMADRMLCALWDGVAAHVEAHAVAGCAASAAAPSSAVTAAGSASATSASKTLAK